MTYDSRPDTYAHIAVVRGNLLQVAHLLIYRGHDHDLSKLEQPELAVFDEFTPKLRDSTYGSHEYQKYLRDMGVGLEHHYAVNDHHPEHFHNGIHDMDLIQLMEMLADWKAATLRHKDGSLRRSIEENGVRFGYDKEIWTLLMRTADNLGWLD
jgi:Family of unknown function (DUF5662)